MSCNGQNKSEDGEFKIEIPSYSNGELDLFYKLTKQKSEQLELDDLTKGYDSLQIRIWYDYSLINHRELIVFKYHNSKWWGYHYNLEVNWNSSNLSETIEKFDKEFIFPKTDWENFIAELLKKKILELPNMDDIKGLEDYWTDGITYNVEIGTKDKYRFYSYHLPNKFLNFWQAKNMMEILDIVQSEFNIPKK